MSVLKMSSEQKMIRNEVKKFTAAELDPISSDIEREGRVPPDTISKICQMGLLGLTVPETYGGSGLGAANLCVALEELSVSCPSLALVVAVNNCLLTQPILRFGSAHMKESYLRRIAKGAMGGCVPYTPIETAGQGFVLEEKGDNQHISGKSDIVLAGMLADFFGLPVQTSNGVSLYLIDKDQLGMATYPMSMMGMRASGTIGLELRHTGVLEDNALGMEAIEHSLQIARIGYSAIALGLTRAALDGALEYSKERKQFGRAICEFPMVQEMLAEIKLAEERSRLLVYDAASRFDDNEDFEMAAHVACLTSCEGAVSSALKAIQIHGGYGYTRDYPVERFFRDAKSLQLLGGTPVDLKGRIAREIIS